ncbi:glycerophosphodiester phosphodiesterase family protein [Streptomyces hyaluromycini]|uniref:glycerophosphodiester phosphodiesterase family protein n=1 Tax=Streptomyces hyaluromycini TaxID=1377993 RepID=UPI000B5C65C6|nr:glycerophosphodiester phosphodiesterase family protein [Streptomyces hyaluromycini]
MRIAAIGGNALHAPPHTRTALTSAYVQGADVLVFDVAVTADGHVVPGSDRGLPRQAGSTASVGELTLTRLRELDLSTTFKPRGSPEFRYRPAGHAPVRVEALDDLLDALPDDVTYVVRVSTGGTDTVAAVIGIFVRHAATARLVVAACDPELLRHARRLDLDVGTALTGPQLVGSGAGPDPALLDAALQDGALDLVLAGIDDLIGPDGRPTGLGVRIGEAKRSEGVRLGVLVLPRADRDLDDPALAAAQPYTWAVGTESTFDIAEALRPGTGRLDETFAGTHVDTRRFALGYAKATPYGHVFQDDGIHIRITPYQGDPQPPLPVDPVERRLAELAERSWDALGDWPFYSGGGFGVTHGLRGDFAAEVRVESAVAAQATMCEMAAVNADPGTHHPPYNDDGTPWFPRSFRDKDAFYDPHGAPPFVGAEHDEDDGYRINWNLGTLYDTNQYGPPVGDGRVLAARLRLERRGAYFAAYTRNDVDAHDWVCVGTVRNDSMNETVHLRCSGKRWRQEDPADPTRYMPIQANEFVFRDLHITSYF